VIYPFRWHPYSFSYLLHFQSTIRHDYFMHFCDKFWDSGTFWPSTMRITAKLSRPYLNLLVHLTTVEYERAESPSVFWKLAWIYFAFIPFFMKYLITAQISVFFHFHKSVHGDNNKESSLPLSCSKGIDAPHVWSQRLWDYCTGTSLC
jgi:hypothetical protein